jgi:hypothetical protein
LHSSHPESIAASTPPSGFTSCEEHATKISKTRPRFMQTFYRARSSFWNMFNAGAEEAVAACRLERTRSCRRRGRAVFSDVHVAGGTFYEDPFPTECKQLGAPNDANRKALEFLTACRPADQPEH